MMVFDLPAWNGRQTTGRITDYYQQHSERLIFLEQDALNAVVNGAFADLDKRYNFLIEVNNPLMIKYPEMWRCCIASMKRKPGLRAACRKSASCTGVCTAVAVERFAAC